jgi:hypothetical protein
MGTVNEWEKKVQTIYENMEEQKRVSASSIIRRPSSYGKRRPILKIFLQ